jgi:hypothetical protein
MVMDGDLSELCQAAADHVGVDVVPLRLAVSAI